MYRIAVSATFSAAHRLRLPDGSYEPLHGHDWHVAAYYAGKDLDDCGLLIDFVHVRAALRDIVAALDHSDLNAQPLLAGRNPSAENVARVIFDRLAETPFSGSLLRSVRVTEEPGCRAEYTRD